VTIPVASDASQNQVIVKATIAVTRSIAPYGIADAISTWSSTVPAAISGVVAVYKLAAFIVRAAKNPATPIASSAALRRGSCWYDQRQQQSHDGDGKKVMPRMLHKILP
jgi:hypothetical protein